MRFDGPRARLSWAVWVPFVWLVIGSSRPISNWMSFSPPEAGYDQYLDGSPLDRNVLTGLLLLVGGALVQRRRRVAFILKNNPALLVFLAYCGLSMIWADYPFVVFKRWTRSLADVAMVCVFWTEVGATEAFTLTMTRVASVLVPLSLLFIRFFPSLGRAYSYSGEPMWTGVASDKNGLGSLCMLCGAVLLTRWVRMRSGPGRHRHKPVTHWVIATLLLMVVYLLSVINSKTALICFWMAATLILLREYGPRSMRKPVFLTGTMIGMIAAAYMVTFGGIGSSVLSTIGRDSSLTNRTAVWADVLPFAVNRWIGAGFENFWIGPRLEAIEAVIGGKLNQAHNGYLEVYLNIGWIGLALLGGVLVCGYRSIFKSLAANTDLASLKLAFFLMCLVYNFTEASFKIMSPVWITFLWATMPPVNLAAPRAGRGALRMLAPSKPGSSVRSSEAPEKRDTYAEVSPAFGSVGYGEGYLGANSPASEGLH